MEQAINLYLQKRGFKAFTPKAMFFDMDGVLFDSMPYHAASWVQTCTSFGLEMDKTEAYMHEGRTGASTINILTRRHWGREATEQEIADIYAEKCRLFNACPEAPKMPGAQQVLEAVKQAALTIVVVTGSGQQSLLDRLNTNYPGFFTPELIVSSKDVKHGKPHPEPYLKALEMARVEPWESIVIENAPLGVEAGARAGAFTVAVTTGPIPEDELWRAGADLVLPSMEALADNLDELLMGSRKED